jgi:hypothetical protein
MESFRRTIQIGAYGKLLFRGDKQEHKDLERVLRNLLFKEIVEEREDSWFGAYVCAYAYACKRYKEMAKILLTGKKPEDTFDPELPGEVSRDELRVLMRKKLQRERKVKRVKGEEVEEELSNYLDNLVHHVKRRKKTLPKRLKEIFNDPDKKSYYLEDKTLH